MGAHRGEGKTRRAALETPIPWVATGTARGTMRIMALVLRLLRSFVTIADEGSLARAAARP
jgi:hypothetical protein